MTTKPTIITPSVNNTTRRAFTLVELLVVITIIAIGALLLVPAFGRISASVSYTGAVNSVTATLGAARTLAVRENRHTAVVFLWDEETERVSLQIVVQQSGIGASLSEFPGGGSVADNYAFAYRPIQGQVPVVLPKGTAIYGLSLSVEPTAARIDSQTPGWYAGHVVPNESGDDEPMWLFPRNDPSWSTQVRGSAARDAQIGLDPWKDLTRNDGTRRLSDAQFRRAVRASQTFCVQFAPDGTVVNSVSAGGTSTINAYLELSDAPLDLADRSLGAYDNDLLFDPDAALNAGDPEENREVFMRSATQIAIVEVARLRERFGLVKPWHVQSQSVTTPFNNWAPRNDYINDELALDLNRWIDQNAEILAFNRYSGGVLRREPQ